MYFKYIFQLLVFHYCTIQHCFELQHMDYCKVKFLYFVKYVSWRQAVLQEMHVH